MQKPRKLQARPMGFLSIRCEKCGQIRGFHANAPMQYSRCKGCDRKTMLTDLVPAALKCKCGKRVIVSTNHTGKIISITCPFCRAPVDLELDRDGCTYRTMEDGGHD